MINPRFQSLPCALLILAGASNAALAETHATGGKSGEQVYKEVCVACHKTGVAHAPKFSDKKAWTPLIEEGQAVLTGHAWVGVRAMPARGGNPDLSIEEFSRGVAYMASKAGGNWRAPDAPMLIKIMQEAEKRLDRSQEEIDAMRKELRTQLDRVK